MNLQVVSILLLSICLGACNRNQPESEQPKTGIDSARHLFLSGFVALPCGTDLSDSNAKGKLEYVRYSTEHRFDLLYVDPRMQIIPLSIGNYWKYRLTPQLINVNRGNPAKPVFVVDTTVDSIDDEFIDMLHWWLPDSLADTVTLPLIDKISYDVQDRTGNHIDTTVIDGLGVRKWYTAHPRNKDTDHLVFSSDPRGVVIGWLQNPSDTWTENVKSRDTVQFMEFIVNEPHQYDSCGNRTKFHLPTFIHAAGGNYLSYPYERFVGGDTLYYTPGVGVTRSANFSTEILYAIELLDYHVQ
jgi:hypothetical protein